METALLPQEPRNISNRVGISIELIVGLVALIISIALILHRMRPAAYASTFVSHPNIREEQHRKGIESYMLESIPGIRYTPRPQSNEQCQTMEPHDSVPYTYPAKIEVPATRDGHQPRYVYPKATVVASVKGRNEEMAVKNPRMPDQGTVTAAYESQNIERPGPKNEPLNCPVCTEDFVESEDVRMPPCGHIYHQLCIDPWLLNFAGSCPLW